jgi:energy-coupling factor transporter transmembrane protein EcfT
MITGIIKKSGLPLIKALKDIKPFIIFLLFVFIVRLLTTEGEIIFKIAFISITAEGINEGAKIVLKLFSVMLAGYILIATTETFKIKAAIENLLKPVPFVPEKIISTMLGLLIRFIPLIIFAVKETDSAQKVRFVDNRKNPVYRIKKLIIPVIFKIINTADNLAIAMEARGYNEDRTGRKLTANKTDWIKMFIGLTIFIILICFS